MTKKLLEISLQTFKKYPSTFLKTEWKFIIFTVKVAQISPSDSTITELRNELCNDIF